MSDETYLDGLALAHPHLGPLKVAEVGRAKAWSAKQENKAARASASREGSSEALWPWEAAGVSSATWYRRRAAEAPVTCVGDNLISLWPGESA